MTEKLPRRADLVFRNAAVIDGTGAARFGADVAVADTRIIAVGDLAGLAAGREIDATGLCLAPGFIDVHTHDDNLLLAAGEMTPKVTQGVTTVVTGNCGVSLAPLEPQGPVPPPLDLLGGTGAYRFAAFADYLDELTARPAAVNAVALVGHTTLRAGAMADLDRPARDRELAAMQERLRESLAAGAAGLSSGLAYAPARAAPSEEVLALVEVLAGSGALYTTHMRDEGDGVEESLQETFETAASAGVPVVISHHKCLGRDNFGRSGVTLAQIERACGSQDVGLDAYPYTASSTVLIPAMVAIAERVMVTWSETHPEMTGRDLAEIAEAWGCSEAEAIPRLQPAGAIYFSMDEADVQRILAYPRTMVGSDGLPHDAHPHPRLWGTFPRVLGHYARDLGLFGFEEAVHRMTGLAAARFGLEGRGVIAEGAFADLVLFDAETLIDRASFAEPCTPAAGIAMVVVNGEVVLEAGQTTGARPGKVLRRAASAAPR